VRGRGTHARTSFSTAGTAAARGRRRTARGGWWRPPPLSFTHASAGPHLAFGFPLDLPLRLVALATRIFCRTPPSLRGNYAAQDHRRPRGFKSRPNFEKNSGFGGVQIYNSDQFLKNMYEFTEKQQILIQNFEFGQSPTKFLNSGTVDLWTQRPAVIGCRHRLR
jgi:hypothetical protein